MLGSNTDYIPCVCICIYTLKTYTICHWISIRMNKHTKMHDVLCVAFLLADALELVMWEVIIYSLQSYILVVILVFYIMRWNECICCDHCVSDLCWDPNPCARWYFQAREFRKRNREACADIPLDHPPHRPKSTAGEAILHVLSGSAYVDNHFVFGNT
jgi:hypothetical protein